MAWLKSIFGLESGFRAPNKFAHSAAQLGKHASSLFEIRSSPGKGLGVFATKNIPRDAVIMRDPVVFQYQKGENLMEQYHRFTMLPKTTRRNILNLTAPYVNPCGSLLTLSKYRSRMPKKSLFKMVHLQNITASNVLPTYYDAKLCGGLFLNACRINHSCIPNADHASKDDYGYMVMRANRDIDAGEEITYSYTMHCAFRVVRQHLLSERWDFTCQCPACDPWHPFCHSHEQRFHTLNKLCQDVDADKEGRLKSAETWPYAALEQESDRSRRRIELLAEHHSLREFSHDEYLRAFDIALAKYKLRRNRCDLEDALKFLELTIQEVRIYHGEASTITRGHEELYGKLRTSEI